MAMSDSCRNQWNQAQQNIQQSVANNLELHTDSCNKFKRHCNSEPSNYVNKKLEILHYVQFLTKTFKENKLLSKLL